MIEIFKNYVKGKGEISDADWQQIESVCQVKKLRRRHYLLQEGDVWKFNAFVTKGCLRTYKVDDNGNEHIINFAVENWWIGDRESLVTEMPSVFNIDALEDSEVVLITKANFDKLCETIPEFDLMVKKILHNSFVVSQNRIYTFISLTAEEKYTKFLEKFPHLSMRVPQGMIASYLGITPETLSRIRKQTYKKQ